MQQKEPLISHDEYFKNWAKLLLIESKAESQRVAERRKQFSNADAERSGQSLLDLIIYDAQPGLGGKFIVQLFKRNRDQAFPWNRFKVGSPVVLSHMDSGMDQTWQAVVCGCAQNEIQIACSQLPEGEHLRLDLSNDEITLQRQLGVLKTISGVSGRTATLRDYLMGLSLPRFDAKSIERFDGEFHAQLNHSQIDAVQFALSAQDYAIIHGPPGTGKTTTVVELIHQCVRRGEKVLACAPSNTAVDNLVEKLIGYKIKAVRLGHPARVSKHLRKHSLDLMVENNEQMKYVRQMLKEAEQLFREADRFTRAKPSPGYRQQLRAEAKQMKADARKAERQAINSILDQSDVICTTTSADFGILHNRYFDTGVIDEACQSTEPGCWAPVMRCDKIILAGDHRQLPPTVVSAEAAEQGLGTSMLERLAEQHGEQVTRRLTVQYRMHNKIAQFSSDHFYDGMLTADPTVASHLLHDLSGIASDEFTQQPHLFIDTAGANYDEELEPEGLSKLNTSEARLVIHQVHELLQRGVAPAQIAVIAPYAAQVRCIKRFAQQEDKASHIAQVEVDTVDGFQGREKEAVVISLVRSNSIGEIGFLADERRMNVAMTRAKRKLIIIGDSATLARHSFFKKLIDHFEANNAYHTVWEYSLT